MIAALTLAPAGIDCKRITIKKPETVIEQPVHDNAEAVFMQNSKPKRIKHDIVKEKSEKQKSIFTDR